MNVRLDQLKDTDESVKKFARFGMFAKGTVYIILGVLTAMAAFSVGGGKTTGKSGALEFIYGQPFGRILLGLVAFGLLCYAIWRLIQSFKDPENNGTDTKAIIKRIGYFFSALVYGLIAFEAAKMIFSAGSGGGSGGNGQKQSLVAQILELPAGQWIIGAVALIFFGKAFYQFYRSLSGKFAHKVQESDLDQRIKSTLRKAGMAGYIARGIVIGIIGYFFLQAAMQSNPNQVKGTKGAFQFISEMAFGPWLLGIVAIGLACYGVFMFVKARYKVLPSSI
ncbi:MAG: DUF1206 domain-containing protein [Cyclobacteriaceae bacterium]